MIRILKENDIVDIEHLSDKQIQDMYDEQESRIQIFVDTAIDNIIQSLPKYVEAIKSEIIKEYIPSYYFDKNGELEIVTDSDDFEDRMEEIKDIIKLKNTSDSLLTDDLNNIIKRIIVGED